jgi:hypothetical protein
MLIETYWSVGEGDEGSSDDHLDLACTNKSLASLSAVGSNFKLMIPTRLLTHLHGDKGRIERSALVLLTEKPGMRLVY